FLLAVLCLISTLVLPRWPVEMLLATRHTPLPTDYFPGLGSTWFLALKAHGLSGWQLWTLYLAVAIPAIAAVGNVARTSASPLPDVLSISLLAVFFVAPYGQAYDFPVLLIPVLVLVGTRLPPIWGGALLLVVFLGPYAHIACSGLPGMQTGDHFL